MLPVQCSEPVLHFIIGWAGVEGAAAPPGGCKGAEPP